jgi:hypothetical protein
LDAVALERIAEGGPCSIAFNRTLPLQGGTASAYNVPQKLDQ